MAEYIDIEVEDDPAAITEDITTRLQAAIPGWVPARTGPLYILAAAWAFIIAELMSALRLVTREIFKVFGQEIAGVAQTAATPSTATCTVTSATSSFTVEEGTVFGIDDGAGGLIAFEVVADVATVDGSAEGVQLISQEAGAHTAGLTGPVVALDALAYDPTAITLGGATAGGTDAEPDSEYLPRLSERLRLISDRVISGEDAAILARQVPGVWRAMAIDNYDVDTNDDAAEGKIALALMDEDGNAVSAGVLAEVQALVEPATILGLEIGYADPNSTAVAVTVTAVAHAGYDTADVESRVEAALTTYLSKSTWGSVPFGDERTWRPQQVVRYLEVAAAINEVEGVDYISTLTVAGGTIDVSVGSLPWSIARPGALSVTINAPS